MLASGGRFLLKKKKKGGRGSPKEGNF